MQYKVHIALEIWSECRRRYASGYVEIELPFPPYKGLQIELERGTTPYCLAEVVWERHKNYFSCTAESDQEDWSYDPPLDMEFLIEEHREAGFEGFEKIWELPELRD